MHSTISENNIVVVGIQALLIKTDAVKYGNSFTCSRNWDFRTSEKANIRITKDKTLPENCIEIEPTRRSACPGEKRSHRQECLCYFLEYKTR